MLIWCPPHVTRYYVRQQTGREKYNNEVFMVWAGAGRHGLTDTDWIYLKFSKVSLSLQTEFIISRQSELTDMKDNENKIDCTLILWDHHYVILYSGTAHYIIFCTLTLLGSSYIVLWCCWDLISCCFNHQRKKSNCKIISSIPTLIYSKIFFLRENLGKVWIFLFVFS